MKDLTTIGFIAAASLLLFGFRIKVADCTCQHCACSCPKEGKEVQKRPTNRRVQPITEQAKNAEKTPSIVIDPDVKKWASKEGVIDVAIERPSKSVKQLRIAKQLHLATFQTPSQLDTTTRFVTDLRKWGTRQGVIDVANDHAKRKKEQQKTAAIKQTAKEVRSTYLAGKKRELQAKGKIIETEQDLLAAMEGDLQTTQVTIANTSDQIRTVRLWNANRNTSVSPPLPTDVNDHEVKAATVAVNAIHQQGAVINPKNNMVYTVGQLSDNVLIYDLEGNFIREVRLTNNLMPGSVSPVDLAVDSDATSPYYGNIYVVGSVSNEIYEVTTGFELVRTFDAGRRPMAIEINLETGYLYVTNHMDATLSVIDRLDGSTTDHVTGSRPLGITFDSNGRTYVANSGADSITIYSQDFGTVTQVENLPSSPSQLAYHASTGQIYASVTDAGQVAVIDQMTSSVTTTLVVGDRPFAVATNPKNDFVYVANSGSSSISIIDGVQLIETLQNVANTTGLAFTRSSNLFVTTSLDTVQSIGFLDQSSSIEIDNELMERAVEFQNQPVKIAAARFVVSGNDEVRTLRLRKQTYTGTVSETSVSLTSVQSPQHLKGTIDIKGLEGTFIDGSNGWDLELVPNQRITMLLTYRQYDPYHLFPNDNHIM